MRITAISIVPPAAAIENPKLTPELQASVLAKYSRSNSGLENILSKVDLANPEVSIEKILKFVDYGHASIGGLTGSLAIVIDGISMYAAYTLMNLVQMGDTQESSTRYITMTPAALPDWTKLGFTTEQTSKLQEFGTIALDAYNKAYKQLDTKAIANPEIVRYPANATESVITRIKKNYALDRARYFLPFALTTNVAIVQSSRMWAETVSALLSSNTKELIDIGNSLLPELTKYFPNLMRHAKSKNGWAAAWQKEFSNRTLTTNTSSLYSNPEVSINTEYTDQELAGSISVRENRYDSCTYPAKDSTISVTWNDITVAEMRDLNRHRTGTRSCTLQHSGFYLPPELKREDYTEFFKKFEEILAWDLPNELKPYILVLGSQTTFKHNMFFDKFVYTSELRTAMGAHYRYAKHYKDAVSLLEQSGHPLTAKNINLGMAEPE